MLSEGYQSKTFNVFGKQIYGLRLLPDSIFVLAWFENGCCGHLSRTDWVEQASSTPSETRVVTTFHGSKMTVSKTWVQKYRNWTVRNLYFCICTVIGFLQGWTEMLYFCCGHSKCMSLCVNMCTHCIYHSSNQTLPCQHVVCFYTFLLRVHLLLIQYSSPLNFILNMNIFYLLTESHSLFSHPADFRSSTRRSSDSAVSWYGSAW